MGCDAIFFLDSDLFSLSKEQKYKEVVRRIGHPIPNIKFESWDTIGNQIDQSGFYSFDFQNNEDERLKMLYIDTSETCIYQFWFEKSFIDFELYDYTEHCSCNIFYVDRWYTFLRNYLGKKKHEGIVRQVNKIKQLLATVIEPVFHCTTFLALGDQVLLHERITDLFYDEIPFHEALQQYPQLKFLIMISAFFVARARGRS